MLLVVREASADQRIVGNSLQGPIYRVEVPYSNFLRVDQPQHQDEWCWAASISNVFRYYGHPVAQERIVQEVWGSITDMPGYPAQIAQSLNRSWTDDNGKRFTARLTAAYDAQNGVNAINNVIIANNLAGNRPLVMCNTHHCMVITEMTYTQAQVLSIGVFDPWPAGPEAHDLPAAEAMPITMGGQLTFVAAVEVSDDSNAGGTGSTTDDSVAGTYSGVFQFPGGALRTVLHITGAGNNLSATIDSPDQNTEGEDVDAIELDGDDLTFSINDWDYKFQGRLSNGHISGHVVQHGASGTLRLSK